MIREFATDFQPPQRGGISRRTEVDDIPFEPDPEPATGTGLYAGEQDMFCFLIDPLGWAEIGDQAFAPGFFVWNSEVGRRSVGIQTFWFQAICQNHIVWDAVEVVEFSRKHTANVHESVKTIRTTIERLVETRDQRRDGFASLIKKSMQTSLGPDAESVLKTLHAHGIGKAVAKRAVEIGRRRGLFTIFSMIDALTRLSSDLKHAGDRVEADEKAGRLLALVG
jgi:hypothetical protein